MARQYRWKATVEGFGEFPIDMLRYDACWPRDESDSGKIGSPLYSADRLGQFRRVDVVKTAEQRTVPPFTDKRWESFGWRVISTEADPR